MGELKIYSKKILGEFSLLNREMQLIKSSDFWQKGKGDIEKNTIKIVCFDASKKPMTIELPNQIKRCFSIFHFPFNN